MARRRDEQRPDTDDGAARRALVTEMVATSRRAQGLPPRVEDAAALAKVSDLVTAGEIR
jgi:hypothetical protein